MSFATLFDYELVGDDFVGLAFDAVAAGVLGAFEAAADIDRAAFGDEAEVGCFLCRIFLFLLKT